MRLRKFSGASAAAAMRDVKRALGDDALILGTRELPGGQVEITAATDAENVTRPLPEEPPPQGAALTPSDNRLGAIEDMLRGFDSQLRRMNRSLSVRRSLPETPAAKERAWSELLGEPRQLAEMLSNHGIPLGLAVRIAQTFGATRLEGRTFEDALAHGVAEILPLVQKTPSANVRFLVGPTGSGKTTTIAKLAAEEVLAGDRQPILLMGDTVRVGAAEQLGAYARLLEVPMHRIDGPDDLETRIAEAPSNAAIFVDTAGLSSDQTIGASVSRLIQVCEGNAGVTAVVSATAARSSLRRSWEQLEGLRPDSCAVTHMDESDEPGIACSWIEEVGLPLSWLGTGQRVPDDLSRATGASLARWLVAA